MAGRSGRAPGRGGRGGTGCRGRPGGPPSPPRGCRGRAGRTATRRAPRPHGRSGTSSPRGVASSRGRGRAGARAARSTRRASAALRVAEKDDEEKEPVPEDVEGEQQRRQRHGAHEEVVGVPSRQEARRGLREVVEPAPAVPDEEDQEECRRRQAPAWTSTSTMRVREVPPRLAVGRRRADRPETPDAVEPRCRDRAASPARARRGSGMPGPSRAGTERPPGWSRLPLVELPAPQDRGREREVGDPTDFRSSARI